MEKELLKKEIIKTGYLENNKIGSIFANHYPELFKEILKITESIQESYVINNFLRPKTIFLFKYDLDVTKLKKNGKWLTFDRKKDDFVDKTDDYRKRGWIKSKSIIPKNYFSKEETIKLLKENENYKKYLGKAKNRTLLKENPKLYNSIFKHTEFMDSFNKNNNKFSVRIIVLVKYNGEENDIKCKRCKNKFTSFNYDIMDFNKLCFNCFHRKNKNKYPQKGWFKEKYGSNWEIIYNDYFSNSYPTKGWFKKFYNDKWEEKYIKFNHENIIRLQNNGNGFSKISQKIFWKIYDKLTLSQKQNCYFKELNNEYFMNTKDGFFFVDFKCGNKIIEFDGVYWHKNSQEKDIKRNIIYKELGNDLLVINENNLKNKRNKIDDELINKCISFINNEN